MHGKLAPARDMLAAAGEWETAMALAVCEGDFASLREIAHPGAAAAAAPAAPPPAATRGVSTSGGGGLSLLDDDDGIFGGLGLAAASAGPTGAAAAAGPTGGAVGGAGGGGGANWVRALAGLSEAERGQLARLARGLVAAHERNAGRMFGAAPVGIDWKVGGRALGRRGHGGGVRRRGQRGRGARDASARIRASRPARSGSLGRTTGAAARSAREPSGASRVGPLGRRLAAPPRRRRRAVHTR
jgi:hypothetical protein